MALCTCDSGFINTGKPGCQSVEATTVKDFIVPKYDSTGALNSFDPATPLTAAFLTGKLNAVNPLDRWYPVGKYFSVESPREASITETIDNIPFFVANGNRTFSAQVMGTTPTTIGALERLRCKEYGVFKIKEDNTLHGIVVGSDGLLYPFPVYAGSVSALPIDQTKGALAKTQISYVYENSFSDADLRYVVPTTANLVEANGLVTVSSVNSAISTTSFTVKLKTPFGQLGSEITVKGLLAGDFALYNVTDSLAVTILTAVETSGSYVITFAAQTSTDVLRLTPTKTGYDFTAVVANTILIP